MSLHDRLRAALPLYRYAVITPTPLNRAHAYRMSNTPVSDDDEYEVCIQHGVRPVLLTVYSVIAANEDQALARAREIDTRIAQGRGRGDA